MKYKQARWDFFWVVVDFLGRITSDGKLFVSQNLKVVRLFLQNMFWFFKTSHLRWRVFYNLEKKPQRLWTVECKIEIMSDGKFAFLLL